MNYSKAVLLVNDEARAIKVSYETKEQNRTRTLYTLKTFDKSIQVGDLVIVSSDTRHGYTICKVEEVDVTVGFDDTIELKWAVGKVDLAAYENVLKEEQNFIDALRVSENRKKREDLKKNLIDCHADEKEMMKLPITSMGDSNVESIESKKK